MMSSLLQNQRGQGVLEAVLLAAVVTIIAVFVAAQFRSNEILATITQGPWNAISAMAEGGIWTDPASARNNHPNHHHRHISVEGELVQ